MCPDVRFSAADVLVEIAGKNYMHGHTEDRAHTPHRQTNPRASDPKPTGTPAKARAFRATTGQIWTHWGLSPGPSACEADVIPLHHVPLMKWQNLPDFKLYYLVSWQFACAYVRESLTHHACLEDT